MEKTGTLELQDPEKLSTIWVKNLSGIVKKMNNIKSMMIFMKPNDSINLDTVMLDKSKAYPEEEVLLQDYLYSMENK